VKCLMFETDIQAALYGVGESIVISMRQGKCCERRRAVGAVRNSVC
jgi:hypothetical protein